jgi:hypothetical protein
MMAGFDMPFLKDGKHNKRKPKNMNENMRCPQQHPMWKLYDKVVDGKKVKGCRECEENGIGT